ncbi:(2Fe-2S)-binding protein [Paracoccus alkanivorans]|uniref:(2Fe-2S)-binding protein n=1 Tax=Paracoccus alkanivorans TaxID=2116655 RepID=A0A3M0MI11_9RHOB|nr:(2Fe-2S)-binding protein [Paracoccus alkanivorans]RMC37278.1 (2Fe-2S)-binding protein [Paracoccus alkanivorans]
MPKRIDPDTETVTFTFEGQIIRARPGDTVASALAASGIRHLRDSAVSGEPRGIFCMMGACFDCLVEVNGQPNRQACMTPVSQDLAVSRQRGGVEVKI